MVARTGGPGAQSAASSPAPDRSAKLKDAAAQFEALLVSQLLRSAREQDGWLGTGEDGAGSSAMEMAEEYFAQALASSGGLGIARMAVRGLQPEP